LAHSIKTVFFARRAALFPLVNGGLEFAGGKCRKLFTIDNLTAARGATLPEEKFPVSLSRRISADRLNSPVK